MYFSSCLTLSCEFVEYGNRKPFLLQTITLSLFKTYFQKFFDGWNENKLECLERSLRESRTDFLGVYEEQNGNLS